MATSAEHTSKSTPGPWVAENAGRGGWIKGSTGEWSALACGDAADANARLITAAPDLLASVKQLLAVYWGDGDGQSPDPYCIQQAKDAISKAEGR